MTLLIVLIQVQKKVLLYLLVNTNFRFEVLKVDIVLVLLMAEKEDIQLVQLL